MGLKVKYLVVTIRRPDFDPQFIAAHYEFLSQLREDGVLEQAGPFTDRTGGAYVLRIDSLEKAAAIAARDPLSIHGCSDVTVREWDSR